MPKDTLIVYIYIYTCIYFLLDNDSFLFFFGKSSVSLAGEGRFLHFGYHSYIAGSCRETAKQAGFCGEVSVHAKAWLSIYGPLWCFGPQWDSDGFGFQMSS